ncbi:WxL domain-containing protein [Levilactobacillus acidifarinae]|uniref:WxL domain-containing protein n=1 Tax=Levilactobacillus acidifarinae DSM 19394 = JCM 15949 TaxID=1423715 RepID=A0A0R1LIF2_9LACO|nr:WxL domain-containing protein [Levilactobacillus acidifarinae]KRK95525.1 hypothetical protein FD25_GL000908 [Levilactobacillus acidifarinae DSM 19394]GEO70230.1 hypothetical protein LAC03_21400 [Levilactobacillus acidifarinae]
MTKKTLQLLATVAAVTGLGLATTATAHAETGTKSTSATVTLNAGPVDPTDPGNAGGIKLVSAPTLNFNALELDGASAQTSTLDKVDPVVITNPGVATGWNVTVANTAFATEANGAGDIIKAGSMVLTSSTPTTSNTDNTDATNVPTPSNVSLNTQGTEAVPVATAAAKSGLGTWNVNYSKADLTVPANNVAGTYTSDLTWTLTNAPA